MTNVKLGQDARSADPDDLVFLHTYSVQSLGLEMRGARFGVPTSTTWPLTNRAFYYPFFLNKPYLLRRWWWLNGATVGTNNLQMGVYDNSFKLVASSTSTLSAGTANQVQYVTPGSPVSLPPMRGYLALWCNGTTATVFRMNNAACVGGYLQDIAGGLPATATPASPSGSLTTWVCGFTRRSSP